MAKQSRNKFLKTKIYYKQLFRKANKAILIGLNVSPTDMFYGLVDHNGNPIYPSETNIKEISSNPEVLALDFVVDAYEEFQRDVEYSLQSGLIKRSSFLYKNEAVKGWKSTTEMYHIHMAKVYEAFFGIYLNKVSRHSQIRNFNDFVMMFLEFAHKYSNIFPFSLTKFVLSTRCSKRSSGLVIEILDKPYNNKEYDINKIVNDSSFGLYQNLVEKHGFKIDLGVAWRLVADIRTSKMQQYMNQPDKTTNQYLRYGLTNISDLFDIYYYKTYRKDVLFLKKYLISFYNHFVDSLPFSKKVCPGKTSVTYDFIFRTSLPESEADQTYNDLFWAVLYFKIRLAEEKINLSPAKISKNARDIASLVGRVSFEQVVLLIKKRIFELSLQKALDKS